MISVIEVIHVRNHTLILSSVTYSHYVLISLQEI